MKIQKKSQILVSPGQKKIRLDKYLTLHIQNSSRTKIQHAIENRWILVNDKYVKSNYNVLPNDRIYIELPQIPDKPDILPENIPLDIVYEDEYLLVVNKPANMVTHPAYKNYSGTLVNALLYYFHSSSKKEKWGKSLSTLYGIERAGIVHRLDKNTSGLLVIAKNDEAHRRLSELFSKHNIEREYWAVVWGHFNNKNGIIEKSLGRSRKDRKKVIVTKGGKLAITHYEVLKEFEMLSLLKLKLMTGRTHQIRVHLHSIGHPVFGDPDYEGRKPHGVKITVKTREKINKLLGLISRQALHAKILGFIHPFTKERMHFESNLPHDFQNLLFNL